MHQEKCQAGGGGSGNVVILLFSQPFPMQRFGWSPFHLELTQIGFSLLHFSFWLALFIYDEKLQLMEYSFVGLIYV